MARQEDSVETGSGLAGGPSVADGDGASSGVPVVGEARWPMATAVLAVIALTLLLPHSLIVRPRWGVPARRRRCCSWPSSSATPARSTGARGSVRAAHDRPVALLAANALWCTGAAHRRAHPRRDRPSNSAGLAAGRRRAWSGSPTASPSACSTGSSTAAARRCAPTGCRPIPTSPFPQQLTSRDRAARLAAALRRLPVPGVHQRDRLQPHRRHAAAALEQARS